MNRVSFISRWIGGFIERWIESYVNPVAAQRRRGIAVAKPARWLWHRLPWPLSHIGYVAALIVGGLVWFFFDEVLPLIWGMWKVG